ncbi:hypothetical protein ACHAWC_003813 [Mediolabrus comicus]
MTKVNPIQPIKANIQCRCGTVKGRIDSPSALRFVCYSKDCRGYYNALNALATKAGLPEAAVLDTFGGCDFTQIYPCEISIHEGQSKLETRLIRKGSPIPRTYAKCCFTPLFSTGGTGAALLNSALLSPEDQHCEVKYRIIGRHALKGDGSVPKPSNMSWSVPFGWFFTMPKRCQPDKAQPSPVELKDIKELEIIEGFASE